MAKHISKEDDNYNEKENLIISLSNVKEKINWNKENKLYDFYDLKEYVDKLLQSLSIDNLKLINNKKIFLNMACLTSKVIYLF